MLILCCLPGRLEDRGLEGGRAPAPPEWVGHPGEQAPRAAEGVLMEEISRWLEAHARGDQDLCPFWTPCALPEGCATPPLLLSVLLSSLDISLPVI